MKKLDAVTLKILRKASPIALEKTLAAQKRYTKHAQWVGKNNRYLKNCTVNLKKDVAASKLEHKHLAEYIAASAPLHCSDGWSLLGRAMECHSRGDAESAKHLGYYAELRAAVSVLATQGVGIFDHNHFAVEDPKRCVRFAPGRGTHEIAWQALEHWADLKRAADTLGETVSISGENLRTWVDHFRSGTGFQPVGSDMLKTWSLDLHRFADDRNSRNQASYRPSHLRIQGSLGAVSSSDFLDEFWRLCEPFGTSRFEKLDRHILRLTLERIFSSARGRLVTDVPSKFAEDVKAMLSKLPFDESQQAQWQTFLTRKSEPRDPLLIAEAHEKTQTDNPRSHLQILSRAALLLRVATAACARLLQHTDLGSRDLRFWWRPFAESRGLWNSGSDPLDLRDLWADVENAINGINEWRAKNPTPNFSFADWLRGCAPEISVLGSCERIALWGLGL